MTTKDYNNALTYYKKAREYARLIAFKRDVTRIIDEINEDIEKNGEIK